MPPARTPAKSAGRAGAGKAVAKRSAAASKPSPAGGSRFSRAFGRLGAAQKSSSTRRGGMGEFLRETRSELRKVEWPTREEAAKLTAAVVALSAVVGIFLGGVDYIFQEIFKMLISAFGGGV